MNVVWTVKRISLALSLVLCLPQCLAAQKLFCQAYGHYSTIDIPDGKYLTNEMIWSDYSRELLSKGVEKTSSTYNWETSCFPVEKLNDAKFVEKNGWIHRLSKIEIKQLPLKFYSFCYGISNYRAIDGYDDQVQPMTKIIPVDKWAKSEKNVRPENAYSYYLISKHKPKDNAFTGYCEISNDEEKIKKSYEYRARGVKNLINDDWIPYSTPKATAAVTKMLNELASQKRTDSGYLTIEDNKVPEEMRTAQRNAEREASARQARDAASLAQAKAEAESSAKQSKADRDQRRKEALIKCHGSLAAAETAKVSCQ